MARTRTLVEDQSLSKLLEGLDDLQENVELWKRTKDIVPPGWLRAHKEAPCHPPKVKMTVRVDREVHEFFRALGVGYQRRMNEVLRCYMHAKHIAQPGGTDWKASGYSCQPTAPGAVGARGALRRNLRLLERCSMRHPGQRTPLKGNAGAGGRFFAQPHVLRAVACGSCIFLADYLAPPSFIQTAPKWGQSTRRFSTKIDQRH